MRVLVTGGRDYDDMASVFGALDELRAKHGRLTVIQGGATAGADYIARSWCAREKSVHMINEPAEWRDMTATPCVPRRRRDGTPYNAAAGGIRNQKMLDDHKPDLVLAFDGGTGTADMVRRAKAAGVPVQHIPRSR